jgi:hypothetical protein
VFTAVEKVFRLIRGEGSWYFEVSFWADKGGVGNVGIYEQYYIWGTYQEESGVEVE